MANYDMAVTIWPITIWPITIWPLRYGPPYVTKSDQISSHRGSRRSAERGVPTNTSRVNVGGDRQGDETLPIALEFDPGVTSDTSQRL